MRFGFFLSIVVAIVLIGCSSEDLNKLRDNTDDAQTPPQASTPYEVGKVFWKDGALMAITAENKMDLIDLNRVKVGAINFDGIVVGINGVEIGYCQAKNELAYNEHGMLVGECAVGVTADEYFKQFDQPPTPQPAPPPSNGVNQPPFAHACADQSHILAEGQTLQVILGGPFSRDDGLIQPLTYSWTPVNGGPSLTNANANYPSFAVSCGTDHQGCAGNVCIYTYQLTVFDGEYSSSDTVNITIDYSGCR